MGMFPVYFLAVRDKSEQKVHYAIVNGQTGKIAMDLPIDFKKYIIGSIIITIPVFILFELSLYLVPKLVLGLAILASLVSMIISNSQLNGSYERERHLDDRGYLITERKKLEKIAEEEIEEQPKKAKRKKKDKYPFKEKFAKYLYKQFIAIMICLLVLAINPVHDYYYYGGAIISLVIIIWAFHDLVKEHNLLMSNKLPQLEKRGGDEHE